MADGFQPQERRRLVVPTFILPCRINRWKVFSSGCFPSYLAVEGAAAGAAASLCAGGTIGLSVAGVAAGLLVSGVVLVCVMVISFGKVSHCPVGQGIARQCLCPDMPSRRENAAET
jgi:hypothetical protein